MRDSLFVATVVVVSVVGAYWVRQAKHSDHSVISESDVPALYSAATVPEAMTVQEKKERFKALMVPAVDEVYQDLETQYREVHEALLNGKRSSRIAELKTRYNVTTDEELLMALKPHPRSIVLAQAAIESAWGTSRFFTEANNAFGVWSFNKDEPRVAARKLRGEKTIWLKKYASIFDAVKDNYEILAKGDAYKEFRALRLETDDPYELVKKLDRYSEKGQAYGEALALMISYNQFAEYDEQLAEAN